MQFIFLAIKVYLSHGAPCRHLMIEWLLCLVTMRFSSSTMLGYVSEQSYSNADNDECSLSSTLEKCLREASYSVLSWVRPERCISNSSDSVLYCNPPPASPREHLSKPEGSSALPEPVPALEVLYSSQQAFHRWEVIMLWTYLWPFRSNVKLFAVYNMCSLSVMLSFLKISVVCSVWYVQFLCSGVISFQNVEYIILPWGREVSIMLWNMLFQ